MARPLLTALLSSVLIVPCMVAGQTQKEEPTPQQTPPAQTAPATPQPAGAPAAQPAGTDSQLAHLRVYRHRRYMGSALAPSIYVDDKQVARIGNGRRVCIRLSPGSHTVRSDDKGSAIALEVKSGQEYYIRVDEETGFWKGHGKLTMLMAEQGSAEYKLQKPVEEERKMAKDMIEEEADAAPAKEKKD